MDYDRYEAHHGSRSPTKARKAAARAGGTIHLRPLSRTRPSTSSTRPPRACVSRYDGAAPFPRLEAEGPVTVRRRKGSAIEAQEFEPPTCATRNHAFQTASGKSAEEWKNRRGPRRSFHRRGKISRQLFRVDRHPRFQADRGESQKLLRMARCCMNGSSVRTSAIKAVSRTSTVRGRVMRPPRPSGSAIFLAPRAWVRRLARTLAEFFGDEDALLQVDMSNT